MMSAGKLFQITAGATCENECVAQLLVSLRMINGDSIVLLLNVT